MTTIRATHTVPARRRKTGDPRKDRAMNDPYREQVRAALAARFGDLATDAATDLVVAAKRGQPACALADVEISTDGAYYVVEPVWAGVDRPRTGSMSCSRRSLALRLAAAIRAGVAYVPRGVLTDVNGQTYVDTDSRVLGRRLNADLRRLGF